MAAQIVHALWPPFLVALSFTAILIRNQALELIAPLWILCYGIGGVAAGAYARSPLGAEVLPQLFERLEEPNAYMRLRYLLSVESILGRSLSEAEYSLIGPPEVRAKQVKQLLEPIP